MAQSVRLRTQKSVYNKERPLLSFDDGTFIVTAKGIDNRSLVKANMYPVTFERVREATWFTSQKTTSDT